MSADLLAEFGLGSAREERGSAGQEPSQSHSVIPSLDSSNDAFFTGNQRTPQFPDLSAASNRSAAPAPTPAPRQPPDFQAFGDIPRSANSDVLFDATLDTPASDEDEDDWGEFEGPELTTHTYPSQSMAPVQDVAKVAAPRPEGPHKSSTASGTIDLLLSLSLEDPIPETKGSVQASKGPTTSIWDDATVDDFGDFTQPSTCPLPSKDLEEMDQTFIKRHPPEPAWDDDSFADWGKFTDRPAANTPAQKTPTPQHKPEAMRKPPVPTLKEKDNFFDDWGEFTDGPNAPPAIHSARQTPKAESSAPTPSPVPGSFISSTNLSSPSVRPTNIPPPSILLDLLLKLFPQLQHSATEAKSHQRTGSSTTDLKETASKIHNTLQTAARIIAGRNLRWKRDTILAQSMRIGPSSSRGGMKLNTVNKLENIKEEQDAVDVLTAWRNHQSLFNSCLQSTGLKVIPAVSEPSVLKVVTEKGALKASHACALCALKRDERVPRVDEDESLHDSFGEWWTEHWGHTQCRLFWEGNRGLLGQR